ncbi:hypothetical protein F441_02490 [Phytophthora nicotianae CJ01A1]|uniref:Tyrosine specific protein phosphatases domain-containing protein n=3 Tax=Phytophthora nicotianae TaxID=4792 RepID=V9FWB2_PHYNI|nr:hypothetical protein F443_02548 [Phytophthora nicotianae P1569]ETK94570.1 hypothetical protein L915_02423 [Phytophthora nicotianae]ETP24551.1 hypothetical protein F441_02490 [Phytophthora nicotianae CJ01A1]ETL47921.1 hypothetical protein L916_02397 [Phytophthora nicotianae]ETM01055.1 hypothetical protein L917_02324 [Phytophthora nicotianae]
MERDGAAATWYEAYTSGDEVERILQDVQYEYEEEVEVEELIDDEPMSINGRLFLGSIDAARNVVALRRLRIGGALALLGKGEGVSAVSGHSSAVGEAYEELKLARTTVEIEDSKDGDLLCKLPKILAELKKLVETAERDDTNVLVHCIAGRSRSASVVTAWMLVNGPSQQSVQDVVDRIRIIRPWIEINSHFMRDLHLFHAALNLPKGSALNVENVTLLKDRSFPRLDFGSNLVDGIIRGKKTITMRLLSDIDSDLNSDLKGIFTYSIVAATTTSVNNSSSRAQFAYLQIDKIETRELGTIDPTTLQKSGFRTVEDVLSVLRQFYESVTTSTPLLMLHFHYMCSYDESS